MIEHPALAESVSVIADDSAREEVIDPARSFIVQAPAGSGKTTLLVRRYLNLLGTVRMPEEILAITFTNKAAREMKSRVLKEITDRSEEAQPALQRSEELGWDISINTQRLKIQTIDSFASGLVQRMPYESQLSLDYHSIVTSKEVYTEASAKFFDLMFTNDPFREASTQILALFDNNATSAISTIASMLANRQHWIKFVRAMLYQWQNDSTFESLFEELVQTRAAHLKHVTDSVRDQINPDLLAECVEVCKFASKQLDEPFTELDVPSDWDFLRRTFLTTSESLRKQVNIRQGFPPDQEEAKLRWKKVCEQLAEDNAEQPLKRLRNFPNADFDEEQKHALMSFCRGLPRVVQILTEVFRERECVDHSEVSFAAQRALEQDEMPTNLALALDYKITHILIDEYQDTSDAQFEFFQRIMSSWAQDTDNTFFAVGDPMQSIYRFRNAELRLFQRTFREGLPNVRVHPIRLSSNFRSVPSLVNWVSRIFDTLFGSVEDPDLGAVAFAASNPAKPKSEDLHPEDSFHLVLSTYNPERTGEAQLVARQVQEIIDRYGPEDSIVLLVPRRKNLPTYFQALGAAGLKWKGVDIVKLKDEPVIRDFYALVQAYNDQRDKLTWLSLFRSPLCGLSLPDLETLAECETGTEMLECKRLSPIGLQLMNRVQKAFVQATEESHLTPRSQIERLWFRLGGNHAYSSADARINSERFLDLLESSTKNEIRLHELWAKIDMEYSTASGVQADLEVMTIHRAKGLEFDHVILADISDDPHPGESEMVHWSHYKESLLLAVKDKQRNSYHNFLRQEESLRDQNEDKRLLYVAMTRAKKSLSVYGRFKEDEKIKSRKNLISHLEPFFSEATIVKHESPTLNQEQRPATILTRVDPEYEWREPESELQIDDKYKEPVQADVRIPIPIRFRRELVLGRLVHRELQRIALIENQPVMFNSKRVTHWRNYLRGEGIEGEDIPRLLEQAQRQLDNVFNDKSGKWLFDTSHTDVQAEAAYTTFAEGEFRKLIIDRTFVDSDDVRWIIDYKTTALGPDIPLEKIKTNTIRLHRAQLENYAKVMRAQESRTIRCAIYLTEIPLLVEIPTEI